MNAHNKAYLNYRVPEYTGRVLLIETSDFLKNTGILAEWKKVIKGELVHLAYPDISHKDILDKTKSKKVADNIQKYLDNYNMQ